MMYVILRAFLFMRSELEQGVSCDEFDWDDLHLTFTPTSEL